MITSKPYWRDSLIVFSRISSWILGPIILALILGKWLDGHFGTAPLLFAITMGISFLISSYGIVRETKKYLKSIPPTTPSGLPDTPPQAGGDKILNKNESNDSTTN